MGVSAKGCGGVCPEECLPGASTQMGGVCLGVYAQRRGVCPEEGCLPRGGVSAQRRGVCPGVFLVALSIPFVFVNCASISALFQIQYLEFYSTYQSALSL